MNDNLILLITKLQFDIKKIIYLYSIIHIQFLYMFNFVKLNLFTINCIHFIFSKKTADLRLDRGTL